MATVLLERHFKADYRAMVRELLETMPVDQAMAMAVGGDYEQAGRVQEGLLRLLDVEHTDAMIDLGCGSGRLASRLARFYKGQFLGVDVVKEMLDYANARTPDNFRFVEVDDIAIPAPDASADLVTAFSLFTHLLHEETFIYLEEAKRVLRPGGRLVFSFLEMAAPNHWSIFAASLGAYRDGTLRHLNMFIERAAIDGWARMLGFEVQQVLNGWERNIPIDEPVTFWNGHEEAGLCAFGQSVAVLRKPN